MADENTPEPEMLPDLLQLQTRLEHYATEHPEIAAERLMHDAIERLLDETDDEDFAHYLATTVSYGDAQAGLRILYHDRIVARVATLAKSLYRSQLLPALRKGNSAFNAFDYAEHLREAVKQRATRAPSTAASPLAAGNAASLAQLAQYWEIPLVGVVRHGEENTQWSLELSDGRAIQVGTTKQLLDQRHVRTVIFDRTGVLIPRISRQEEHLWDAVIETLYLASHLVVNSDASRLGQAREFITLYLAQQSGGFAQDFDDEEWETLAFRTRPFRRDGAIYVHARTWWNACIRHLAPEITYTDTLEFLRILEAESCRVTLNKVAHTDRSYWKLPVTFLPEDSHYDPSSY